MAFVIKVDKQCLVGGWGRGKEELFGIYGTINESGNDFVRTNDKK